MQLDEVVAALDAEAVQGSLATVVEQVSYDSRTVEPGSLFCCLRGEHTDGHDYAPDAVAAGATALLVDRLVDVDVPQVVVRDARVAMAAASDVIYDHPSRALTVIGVTGTNGKTTATYLLRSIFELAGHATAVLGTLSGPRTTPEAPDLQRWLADQRAQGIEVIAMEVSSHALALHRVNATQFAVAVFTNLTREHLDFHNDMDSYFATKARLFTPEFARAGVVNIDDPYGRQLRDRALVDVTAFSLADAVDLQVRPAGSSFTWRGEKVDLALGGRFNVSNALAAATTAAVVGIDAATIAAGLSSPIVVPGRFETIDEGQPFLVVVDYAHTPDALEQLLVAAREVAAPGRVHVVFGCGGDRDATKRPAMGATAARLADRVVLTADNSRHEDTAAIIGAVQQGFEATPPTELLVEADRFVAIGAAIAGAQPGDIVVIAGKGHETTQTIGDTVTPFDDREVARSHLHSLGWGA